MKTPTSKQRLLDVFSAVADTNAELVVFEKDEPEAPEALRAWATSVETRLHEQRLEDGARVLFVEFATHRRGIQVYSQPPRQMEARP